MKAIIHPTSSSPTSASQFNIVTSPQAVAFDGQPCHGTTPDDLDLDAARRAFAGVRLESDDAKLVVTGILVRSGGACCPRMRDDPFRAPTAPHPLLPNSEIRCAPFLGTTKEEFLDRLDVDGTPIVLILEGWASIRSSLRTLPPSVNRRAAWRPGSPGSGRPGSTPFPRGSERWPG